MLVLDWRRMGATGAPEVKVIHGSLGIAHVDVEGVEVDGCFCVSAQHLPEVWQPVALHVHVRLFHDDGLNRTDQGLWCGVSCW